MGLENVIDGKKFAADLRAKVAQAVSGLPSQPGLAVVLVGDDPASSVYVKNKGKQTVAAGMHSVEVKLPSTTTQEQLIAEVEKLNQDSRIHGILVQLPLPKHIEEDAVIQVIDPRKDVDGFHVVNSGLLATGQQGLVPCTPYGCLLLIQDVLGQDLSGKHAVVVGRSNIVGKPMAQLLLNANATVTIAHSRTHDLPVLCQQANIVVAAVGRPNMITADYIRNDALVIDVGINRLEDGSLTGDVDFDSVQDKVKAITPVPGGVGPMTIACLLRNTFACYCTIHDITLPDNIT